MVCGNDQFVPAIRRALIQQLHERGACQGETGLKRVRHVLRGQQLFRFFWWPSRVNEGRSEVVDIPDLAKDPFSLRGVVGKETGRAGSQLEANLSGVHFVHLFERDRHVENSVLVCKGTDAGP